MPFRIVLLLSALCLCLPAAAQQLASRTVETTRDTTHPRTEAPQHPLQSLVERQFGRDFRVDGRFEPMYADFDADGKEDLAIVAFSKNPMGGSGGYKYTVQDPYDSYFGVGDPKITTRFASFGDGSSHCILFIHNWKGETARSKWVIVNVPFDKIAPGQVTVKKKTVPGVATIEAGGLSSLVFFDGKKYRWEPNEFDNEAGGNID